MVFQISDLKNSALVDKWYNTLLDNTVPTDNLNAPEKLSRDHDVLEADVARSLFIIENENERNIQRARLKKLIINALESSPNAYYYQGLHELFSMLVLTAPDNYDENSLNYIAQKIIQRHLKSFCEPKLAQAQAQAFFTRINKIISQQDDNFAKILNMFNFEEFEKLNYTYPSVATWFTYYLNNENWQQYQELFSCMIEQPDPEFITIIYAAFVLENKAAITKELKTILNNYGSNLSDATIHAYTFMNNLPTSFLFDAERLIINANILCLSRKNALLQEEFFITNDWELSGRLTKNHQLLNIEKRKLELLRQKQALGDLISMISDKEEDTIKSLTEIYKFMDETKNIKNTESMKTFLVNLRKLLQEKSADRSIQKHAKLNGFLQNLIEVIKSYLDYFVKKIPMPGLFFSNSYHTNNGIFASKASKTLHNIENDIYYLHSSRPFHR